jgi:hypothetical protein
MAIHSVSVSSVCILLPLALAPFAYRPSPRSGSHVVIVFENVCLMPSSRIVQVTAVFTVLVTGPCFAFVSVRACSRICLGACVCFKGVLFASGIHFVSGLFSLTGAAQSSCMIHVCLLEPLASLCPSCGPLACVSLSDGDAALESSVNR